MAGYAGAGDLGVIGNRRLHKICRVVTGFADVRCSDMGFCGTLQFAYDLAGHRVLRTVVAGETRAYDLAVVYHSCGTKFVGVVASVTRVCRRNVGFERTLQLTQDWSCGNRFQTIMARQARSYYLRVISGCGQEVRCQWIVTCHTGV